MPQRSLFSFYSRGAVAAPFAHETTAGAPAGDGGGGRGLQSQVREPATIADAGERRPESTQREVIDKIRHKFVRRDDAPPRGAVSSAQETTAAAAPPAGNGGALPWQHRGPAISQREVLDKIHQKLVRREDENEAVAPAHVLSGSKRTREEDARPCAAPTAETPDSAAPNNEKRTKLLEALGAGDACSGKGSAWEAAKSKFEWMTPAKIRDGEKRRPGDPLYDARTVHIPDDVFHRLSASQKQYWSTKRKYMDTMLFFKVGKFYELYEVDAEIGHKELDWKLTVSGVGKCRQVGCPESGIDDAVRKLVARGYKVGRMEQTETAAQARASNGGRSVAVQRELTQVVTPATLLDGNLRPEAVHLLSLKEAEDEDGGGAVAIGFAFVDAAAGRFYVGSIRDDCSRSALQTLLTQVAPQEVLFETGGVSDGTRRALRRSSRPGWLPVALTPLQPRTEFMDAADAMRMFRSLDYFRGGEGRWNESGLDSVAEKDLAVSALGALAAHLTRLKCDDELLRNGALSPYEIFKGSLRLDGQTVENLELLQNRAKGGKEGTLLSYVDSCVTQFGKRLLRRWICHPLKSVQDIEHRLDAVDELRCCWSDVSMVRAALTKIPDLERLVARLHGLAACPVLGLVPAAARKVHQTRLKTFCAAIAGMRAAYDLLLRVRRLSGERQSLKSALLRRASALADSEVGQNCLEALELCIDRSSRSPRLVSQDLNSEENEDALEAEAETLRSLMDKFNEQRFHWTKIVDALAQLDVLISFASAANASTGATCRPQFVQNGSGRSVLCMKGLWHPYATGGQGGAIVPNDVELGDGERPCALLLTGPNMGGKSTLLRATCLAVLMAQLGCFVPCESCTLSPVDTIFTRLGANDRIMTGDSTFMVECTEAASVLRYATSDSLVILDELGRGTSTFDGYAIAYAVLSQLVNNLNCRLMFATHYHPLTQEFAANPLVRLGHMASSFESDLTAKSDSVDESEETLVFLYKLADGACPKSYGLQVARMAGIPASVVRSAQAVQERIAASVDAKQDHLLTDKERSVRAILANSTSAQDSYHKLFSIWQELRGQNKTAEKKRALPDRVSSAVKVG